MRKVGFLQPEVGANQPVSVIPPGADTGLAGCDRGMVVVEVGLGWSSRSSIMVEVGRG